MMMMMMMTVSDDDNYEDNDDNEQQMMIYVLSGGVRCTCRAAGGERTRIMDLRQSDLIPVNIIIVIIVVMGVAPFTYDPFTYHPFYLPILGKGVSCHHHHWQVFLLAPTGVLIRMIYYCPFAAQLCQILNINGKTYKFSF